MSSMTPSAPHSFSGTVPGGATFAPGGTQPSAAATTNGEHKASLVIAALIAGFAETSQDKRGFGSAEVGSNKRNYSLPAYGCISPPSGGPTSAPKGWILTMSQTLFALVVLAIGPTIPQTAAA